MDLPAPPPSERPRRPLAAQPLPLAILHEDDHLLAVNKPAGVVSTAREPGARRAVVELVKHHSQARLYPVGRLDADSTGLLLLRLAAVRLLLRWLIRLLLSIRA